LARAHFILNHLEEAIAETRQIHDGVVGRIRIGFATAAGSRILPALLQKYRTHCPRVEVWLGSILTDIQTQMLLEGKLDFGFVRPPVISPKLTTMTVARAGMVVALRPGHPLLSRERLRLSDLADETFIGLAAGASDRLNERVRLLCHDAGLRSDSGLHAADSYAVLALVAAGCGVGILPEWISRTTQFQVQFRPLDDPSLTADIALVWCSDNASRAHEVFRELAETMKPTFSAAI